MDNTYMAPGQFRKLPGVPLFLMLLGTSFVAAAEEGLRISRVNLPVKVEDRARCVSLPEDADLIAFTSERHGGFGGNDIWMSRWNGEGWSEPYNAGPAINSEKHEFDGRFSRDGLTLIFMRGEIDMWEKNSSRIQISHFEEGNWSVAKPFPDHVSPVDTVELAASLSSDGNRIYFSSNREGGYGRYDHYYSELTETGWSEPVNLGPEVNTKQDEIDMTLGVDGDLLIFPAHREDSIGGSHDLYLSTRVGGLWTKPTNLGPRVNTPGNDTCPWLAYDGYTLYLDSDWEGLVGGGKGSRLVWKIWYSQGFRTPEE
jgi:hypothetical protein